MKKTIVIPTDFTVQSLNVLKTVLNQNESKQQYNIILLHGFSQNDSIRDLLFFSKTQQIAALMNTEFEEAYEVIRNKFDSQVGSIKIDLFTGYNLSAFNTYLEANGVNEIFTSERKQHPAHKNSFDLSRFIAKSQVNATIIETVSKTSAPERGKIAEVFMNQVSIG
ncbi:MAG: hypothetical protein QM710_08810 [Flavobacterium sp.]